MKLTTSELQTAFKIVDLVDTQPGLLSSQFIQLEAKDSKLYLSLTGICVGWAECPVLEPGPDFTWWLDRRVLSAFLSGASAKTITTVLQKDVLLWKAGAQKITSTAMTPVTGYTTWEPKKEAVALNLTPELAKELALHAQYSPATASADHLAAVLLVKGYGTLASDSFVISVGFDKTLTSTIKLPGMLAGKLPNGVTSILVEKAGTGIRFAQGYLYQPLAVNAITSYPLKDITNVVATHLPVKSVVKIKAKDLLDALNQIKGYVFGSSIDLRVLCAPSKTTGFASLTLDVIQGKVETSLAAEYTTDFKLSWALVKLLPWVEFLYNQDNAATVVCGQKNDSFVFSVRGNRHYLLIVAEIT